MCRRCSWSHNCNWTSQDKSLAVFIRYWHKRLSAVRKSVNFFRGCDLWQVDWVASHLLPWVSKSFLCFWSEDASVSSQASIVACKKKTTITALPLTYSSFATKTNWTKLPPFGRGKKKWKKIEFYSRNKDRHSRQVPYCNVYFIALLVFLVLQFSVWFQFLNWTFWRSCTIDSVTIMYQASLVKKSWIHPFFQKGDLCHWKVFNWSLKQIAYKQIRFQLNSSVWPSFTKDGYE